MHFRLLLLWLLTALTSWGQAQEVALTVTEPSGVERTGWPVTSGIPLAQGELRSHRRTALFDANGAEVPLQTEVLSRWPDGTIRWLLLDFQVDLAADESRPFVLRYGPEVTRTDVPDPVTEYRYRDVRRLETGPLRIETAPAGFRLLNAVWLDQDGDGQFSDGERLTKRDTAVIAPSGASGSVGVAKADRCPAVHADFLELAGRPKRQPLTGKFSTAR